MQPCSKRVEVLLVALVEAFLLAHVGFDGAGVVAGQQPLVEALQGGFAGAAAGRLGRLGAGGGGLGPLRAVLVEGRVTQVFQQVGHLDGHAGRVAAFFFGAGPGLRFVLDGQDGVGDGSLWSSATRVTPAPLSLATSSKW
jgi:hypothetical protein